MRFAIYIIYTFLCLVLFSCSGESKTENTDESKNVNPGSFAVMTFEEKEFNFGTIKEGQKVFHEFKFKNTGSADLHIVSVQGNCGCTSPEYPMEPIKSGGEGKITVNFDSKGMAGANDKKIQIIYNGNPKVAFLKIKAKVQ